MFLILIEYSTALDQVDRLLGAHRQFLERHYANGDFLLSGRKEPRTGGVILAKAASKAEVEGIVQQDPFYREQVAQYTIIEFIPTMAADSLVHLKAPA